jgi:hypothetical protein
MFHKIHSMRCVSLAYIGYDDSSFAVDYTLYPSHPRCGWPHPTTAYSSKRLHLATFFILCQRSPNMLSHLPWWRNGANRDRLSSSSHVYSPLSRDVHLTGSACWLGKPRRPHKSSSDRRFWRMTR